MRHLHLYPQRHDAEDLLELGQLPASAQEITNLHEISIHIMDYNEARFTEHITTTPDQLIDFLHSDTITWVNIDGVHDVEKIDAVCQVFNLHPLTGKAIANTSLRAMLEEHDDYLHVVLKMISHDEDKQTLDIEQVSLILGNGFVLSFLENPGDILDRVRERIRQSKGRICKMKADYLFYAIVDAIVHNYPLVLEYVEQTVDDIEEQSAQRPTMEMLYDIQRHKKMLSVLKHLIMPLREVLQGLSRSEHSLIHHKTVVFYKDLMGQNQQVLESIDTLRDALMNLQEFYLAITSHKLNEIMKFLTVFSAIFMPLTLIAGIYGMNFNSEKSPFNMPELNWHYGYVATLGLMAFIALGTWLYFKRRQWV